MKGFDPQETRWNVAAAAIRLGTPFSIADFGDVWVFEVSDKTALAGPMHDESNVWTGTWSRNITTEDPGIIETVAQTVNALKGGSPPVLSSEIEFGTRFYDCVIKARDGSFQDSFTVAFVTDKWFVATNQEGTLIRVGKKLE
ncbi:MAG: hypothetical protein JST85_25295 [Acidobacteria bacterium]|nr:hypothetical protein [Acidobacteriota bacterium]